MAPYVAEIIGVITIDRGTPDEQRYTWVQKVLGTDHETDDTTSPEAIKAQNLLLDPNFLEVPEDLDPECTPPIDPIEQIQDCTIPDDEGETNVLDVRHGTGPTIAINTVSGGRLWSDF
ncbi:MAG: hypothetical protein UV63_C0015G0014 [Microgenomates group bacterium GW2011_GWC1_43_11]|uniref:Uncharacterized protein n=1 Tax=Candidatus Gottesmanbacteria bacterium GW2011_GWA1_44_24b TaxID=1618437 RepID=A0A0G1INB8_9BACT|nr:MAG: hypothetical protein UV63_C0015G0014 [Microgenomates group bacterium GW2011_GWC1_43_11]KKT60911.1 MAG: hypothetical protein UW52_C0015G0011 [Candidatus Gottesmanbacteria bacterium GW2011_GWA1_44_24b]HCM82511.1 hypothetical protein [Patescibacteria group bacterium]